MARRKSTNVHMGDVLPPLPAIPEPQKTRAEIARERELKAETMRLLRETNENLYE
jgi:hypothetical protein